MCSVTEKGMNHYQEKLIMWKGEFHPSPDSGQRHSESEVLSGSVLTSLPKFLTSKIFVFVLLLAVVGGWVF